MTLLEVGRLRKVFGHGARAAEAIQDITFSVDEGEFVCVIGPSGCGKTTLLRCIAGLLPPTSGSIALREREVTQPPDEMALVFQEYSRSLFPWMTVRRNVTFPLRRQRLGRAASAQRAEEAIEAVGLTGLLDHYPWQLSGGMQQRAAIARALAYRPGILLMDEPFASVDAQARYDLEDLILQLAERFGMTVVFVTHDIDEAIYLADRILILTSAPARIKATLAISLPRPRDQIRTKALGEFSERRGEVRRLIDRSG
ncbi:MAG: ABC transporter ATP-binding protein [Acidimicrobiales bacterium]